MFESEFDKTLKDKPKPKKKGLLGKKLKRKVEVLEISIAPKTISLLVFLFILGLVIFKISTFILVVLTAVVITAFVDSLSKILQKIKIPRVLSIVIVYAILVFAFGGLIYVFIPVFVKEISQIMWLFPDDGVFRSVMSLFSDFTNAKEVLSSFGPDGSIFSGGGSILSSLSTNIFEVLSSAFGGVINTVLVFVISFYLSMHGNGVERFLQAVTPIQYEEYILSVWVRTRLKIGLWFKGQLLSALILSVLTYFGLMLLGVPYAFLLAALAGVLGLIPFGIIVATIPAGIIAFITGGVELVLLTFLLYFIFQQIEQYILHPLILNKATGVPSLVILLTLIVAAKLAGFLGIFLGLPVAIMLVEMVGDYEAKKALMLHQH